MEVMEAVLNRRSIRKYLDKAVEDDIVKTLLKAAMYAPSARNYQPWHFIVIDDREVLDRVPTVHPYAEMIYGAPLSILVCGDRKLEPMDEYLAINCSAATQNMLLTAHDLGLGAVWLGVYPRKERMKGLSKLVGLPEHVIPISLVVAGYPDEEIARPERFKEERIHYNLWNVTSAL
jgi:nitroreductase